MIAKNYEKYIFCLEGDWDENLKKKSSILPALDLLNINSSIDSIYKTCRSRREFFVRLEQLLSDNRRYSKYQIIYLAFHGFKGGVQISDYEDITLSELGDFFEGRLKDKMIHFGSCSTMKSHEDEIYNFLEKTEALSISGYQKDIDFISSTVFDVLFFELCQNYKQIKAIDSNLLKNYNELCKQLDFKIYYR